MKKFCSLAIAALLLASHSAGFSQDNAPGSTKTAAAPLLVVDATRKAVGRLGSVSGFPLVYSTVNGTLIAFLLFPTGADNRNYSQLQFSPPLQLPTYPFSIFFSKHRLQWACFAGSRAAWSYSICDSDCWRGSLSLHSQWPGSDIHRILLLLSGELYGLRDVYFIDFVPLSTSNSFFDPWLYRATDCSVKRAIDRHAGLEGAAARTVP